MASASWPLSVDGRLPTEAEPAARPRAGRPPRGPGRRFVSPAPSAAVSPGTKPPVPPGPAGSGTASVAPAAMPADATLDLASAVGEPPNRADAPDNGATFGTRLTAATACGVGANGGASASLSLSATASAGRADVAACAGALAETSRRSLGCRVGRTCGCVGALAASEQRMQQQAQERGDLQAHPLFTAHLEPVGRRGGGCREPSHRWRIEPGSRRCQPEHRHSLRRRRTCAARSHRPARSPSVPVDCRLPPA